MNVLNLKKTLLLAGLVAALATPALAEKRHHATRVDQTQTSRVIPGYDKNGATVAIPDPDSR